MKTITKKDMAKHVAQLLNEKAYTAEIIVDGNYDRQNNTKEFLLIQAILKG